VGFISFYVFPVSSFFGSPLSLSPFSFLWGLSSEVFIWGFISSLPQRAWDKKGFVVVVVVVHFFLQLNFCYSKHSDKVVVGHSVVTQPARFNPGSQR
jgi:hypothetical protein